MVTLKEIAKKTGLAESTISRVLNRDPSLSVTDENRRLIIETAEALNYVPRRARNAQNEDPSVPLRRPEPLKSILIFHYLSSSEELTRPFYLGLRQGIEARCEAYGVNVMRIFPGDFRASMLHRDTVMGAIAVVKLNPDDREALNALGIPLVSAHPDQPHPTEDAAYIDIEDATTMLTDWMLSRDVKRPALIGVPGDHSKRLQGYRRAMMREGRMDMDYVIADPTDAMSAGSQVEQLLARLKAANKSLPDGLIVYADRLAPDAYQALQAAGLKVPDDISVAGFGDTSVTEVLDPPLTSLRLEAGLVGESCVDLLMERIGGRTVTKHVKIQPSVVARASTQKVPRRDSRPL